MNSGQTQALEEERAQFELRESALQAQIDQLAHSLQTQTDASLELKAQLADALQREQEALVRLSGDS